MLRYNLFRQTYSNLQVIFVDGSKEGYKLPEADTYLCKPGGGIGELSNMALDRVEGDYFHFWDDDDWQHPRKLQTMVDYLRPGRAIAWSTGWFFSLQKRTWSYGKQVLPHHIQTLYPAVQKDSARFPVQVEHPDMVWAKQMTSRHGEPHMMGDILVHSFWINHFDNASGRGDQGMLFPLDLRDRIGDAWGETDAVLELLSVEAARRAAS